MTAISFDALDQTIGTGAALRLCAEYGGTEIIVPRRPGPKHPIVRTIGLEAAKKLNAEFGNIRLDLPMGPARGQRGRRSRVAQLLDQGFSASEAARKADVHVRTVWRVKGNDDSTPLLDAAGVARPQVRKTT